MENILKIIYDKSINNKIIDIKDIDKILDLLINEKQLNNYILNIDVQPIRSNNLASYSNYSKKITVYYHTIELMLKNIESNILNIGDFEKILYKNLSLLQVILHEVEHANQEKIAYNENSLEAFIIRLSYLVKPEYNEKLYEFQPEERLAEIKSYENIIQFMNYFNDNLIFIPELLNMELLRRQLLGYHYKNSSINIPIVDFFTLGNKSELLNCIDLSSNFLKDYSLNNRFKYGFPISLDEYGNSVSNLVLKLNKNFKNMINLK